MTHLTVRRLVAFVVASLAFLAVALFATLLVSYQEGWIFYEFWNTGSDDYYAIYHWRLPRALAAAVVGAGLAAAGCAFQAALRNPLAEPFTLGISSAASLLAVIAISLGLDQALGHGAIGGAALLGAALSVVLVWRLGKVGDTLPPATLILAGITIAMFCGAATMLVQYTSDFSQVYRMVSWMMGGLDQVRYPPLWTTGVAVLLGIAVLVRQTRSLNAMAGGQDAAASLGVQAERVTKVTLAAASVVVGACISLAGPIGFIGLMVPHGARALVGPDHRVLLPVSAITGATALVVCDALAQAAGELPVGVVTALLGGPFFVSILLKEKRRGSLWGG